MSEITMLPCPHCGSNNCNVEIIKYTDATWRYYGYCYDCEMCGPSVPESEGVGIAEVKAAERWNALPRRLKWTREKPTEPGWYWHCKYMPSIVRVVKPSSGRMFYYISGYPDQYDVLNDDGEWAGPIQKPEE